MTLTEMIASENTSTVYSLSDYRRHARAEAVHIQRKMTQQGSHDFQWYKRYLFQGVTDLNGV